MSPNTSVEQTRLLAGVIAHLSRYLETGCPRAAERAGLLLRHLDASVMDQELMTSCEALDRAISRPHIPGSAGAPAASSTSRRPRLRSLRACVAGLPSPN
ncbi:hypothetical protein [Thauera sp. WH-1]|uniref:hypothetical protein n=1 Tax=Thauera sp. WH-1 TaxID=3398230 RepID=UPI0039FCAEA1